MFPNGVPLVLLSWLLHDILDYKFSRNKAQGHELVIGNLSFIRTFPGAFNFNAIFVIDCTGGIKVSLIWLFAVANRLLNQWLEKCLEFGKKWGFLISMMPSQRMQFLKGWKKLREICLLFTPAHRQMTGGGGRRMCRIRCTNGLVGYGYDDGDIGMSLVCFVRGCSTLQQEFSLPINLWRPLYLLTARFSNATLNVFWLLRRLRKPLDFL